MADNSRRPDDRRSGNRRHRSRSASPRREPRRQVQRDKYYRIIRDEEGNPYERHRAGSKGAKRRGDHRDEARSSIYRDDDEQPRSSRHRDDEQARSSRRRDDDEPRLSRHRDDDNGRTYKKRDERGRDGNDRPPSRRGPPDGERGDAKPASPDPLTVRPKAGKPADESSGIPLAFKVGKGDTNGGSQTGKGRNEAEGDAMDVDEDEDEVEVVDDGLSALQAMMGFGGFGTTKNTKVKGNNVGAVRKEKKTEYRQYMNRLGGFNRPLSPGR